jgi:two-component system, chemotaxis family, response regulator WspR
MTSTAVLCSVLLVDDQAMVGEALRRMLAAESDVTLHVCTDPAAALTTARTLNPTVILLDLVMPGVNGFELLERYRADVATSDIPIIVLSSKEDPKVKSEAFTAGASDYLVKLPDPIELAARIRLHSRARINQLQRHQAEARLMASNAELLILNQRLEEATEALRLEATRDSLSGLLNRRAFFDGLQRELLRSRRTDEPIALIMSDIDHFSINDSRGHLAGDAVIQEVARRLQTIARGSDLVGRYGGEEFVVLASDCSAQAAGAFGERLRRGIANSPFALPDGEMTVTISIGLSLTGSRASAEDLLAAADAALLRAKHAGRNRVELSPIMA